VGALGGIAREALFTECNDCGGGARLFCQGIALSVGIMGGS